MDNFENQYILGEINSFLRILKPLKLGQIQKDDVRTWLIVRTEELGIEKTKLEELESIKVLSNKFNAILNTSILELQMEIRKEMKNPKPVEEKYFTTKEIVNKLGITRGAIKLWIDRNEFPNIKSKGPKTKLIPYSDFVNFLNKNPKYRVKWEDGD